MTIKQQINHGVIQKVWHFSSHSPVSHLSDFSLSHPVCYSLKITNYGLTEKTTFVYMDSLGYHVISKEVENCILRYNHILRNASIYKQPLLKK